MSITPSSAPTLRRIYVDFLGGLPSLPFDSTAPECMKYALGRLAELAADPSIASRSLKSPMTFSLVPSCARQSKGLLNVSMHEATNTGFLPFPHDYRSERKCVAITSTRRLVLLTRTAGSSNAQRDSFIEGAIHVCTSAKARSSST